MSLTLFYGGFHSPNLCTPQGTLEQPTCLSIESQNAKIKEALFKIRNIVVTRNIQLQYNCTTVQLQYHCYMYVVICSNTGVFVVTALGLDFFCGFVALQSSSERDSSPPESTSRIRLAYGTHLQTAICEKYSWNLLPEK